MIALVATLPRPLRLELYRVALRTPGRLARLAAGRDLELLLVVLALAFTLDAAE